MIYLKFLCYRYLFYKSISNGTGARSPTWISYENEDPALAWLHARRIPWLQTSQTGDFLHERFFEEFFKRFEERGNLQTHRKEAATIARMTKMLRYIQKFPFTLAKVQVSSPTGTFDQENIKNSVSIHVKKMLTHSKYAYHNYEPKNSPCIAHCSCLMSIHSSKVS